jgi:flagellar hook-basal body complex protein FliE
MMEPISYSALKIVSAEKAGEIAPQLKPAELQKNEEGLTFKELMGGMVRDVDRLQKNADSALKDLAAGRRSDVHNIAIKMDEAGVAFDLMMQIRNKMVEGFKEISRMQA